MSVRPKHLSVVFISGVFLLLSAAAHADDLKPLVDAMPAGTTEQKLKKATRAVTSF